MKNNGVKLLKRMLWMSVMAPILLSLSLFGANPVKIMPLGDSITKGYVNGISDDESGYRGPLWSKLLNGEYHFDFVGSTASGQNYDTLFDSDHDGYNGFATADINDNLLTYLGAVDPQIILLHIGTNDIEEGYDVSASTNNVESILDTISTYNPSIKVILARIIDRNSNDTNPPDTNTTAFNDSVVAMANDHAADIDIVDMEKGAGIDYATDMEDTWHPNDTGYAKMANEWYSALSTVLTPIVPLNLWKLDETSGSIYVDFYSSGADGNCTAPGCPTPVEGQINGAQRFDSDDDAIDVMDTASFNWTADANVTIEFWMNSDVSTKEENEVIIGRKGELASTLASPAYDIWYVGIHHSTGTIAYGVGNRGGAYEDLKYGHGTAVVTDNTWNHIAYVVTSDRIMVYVNGQIDVDVARKAPGTEHIEGTSVNMGYMNWARTASEDRFEYKGMLDEVSVYDAALSAGLIRQHYENGLNPPLCDIGERIKQGTDQCIGGIEPEIPMPYLDSYTGLIQGTDDSNPDASEEPMSNFLPDPISCTEGQHLVQGSNTCI